MTWNEDIPALGNAISSDVPDIKENLEFLALWLKERRSTFTYNGGTTAYTIKCKPAYYYCKDKVCWWDAELTTGAISSPVKDDWYYLYLDHSGITSGTEITNSELLWSSTEPAWSDTYAGWYNGDDRCIFAVRTNSTPSNILEFFNSGDYVRYANYITDQAATNITDATWYPVAGLALTMPVFSLLANVYIEGLYVSASSAIKVRTNGQTGSTGQGIGNLSSNNYSVQIVLPIITDSSQKIQVYKSGTSSNTVAVYTNGWYFPAGI